MSKKFKFVLNRAGVRHLLHSKEMEGALVSEAEKIRPNGDYDIRHNKNRVFVIIKSEKEWNNNTEHNTLLKNMYGNKK